MDILQRFMTQELIFIRTKMNKKLAEYYLKMAKDAGLKRAIEKYKQYEFGEER